MLEDLILQKVQEARVEEIIEQTLERIKTYYGLTDEELVPELAKDGLTLEAFREELRAQAAKQALLEALRAAVIGEIEISEEEITTYYEQNPDQFQDAAGNALHLEEVGDKIASLLLAERQEEAWEEWLRARREAAVVEINL